MGISVTRNGFRSLDSLVFKLQEDLVTAGFELVRFRSFGERTPDSQLINPSPLALQPVEGSTAQYLFKATGQVDILAAVEPWFLLIEVHPNFLRTWALTEDSFEYDRNDNLLVKQIPEHSRSEHQLKDEDLDAGATYQFGHMSKNGLWHKDDPYRFFLNIIPGASTWEGYEDVGIDANGFRVCAGAPLSYTLTVSSYGVVFVCHSPVLSHTGNCHSWFCIQRLVNRQGKVDYTKGFNPVWCLFSQNGGGEVYQSVFDIDDSGEDFDKNGVSQFCVRERDIYYPTPTVSALVPSSIGCPIVNNRQSVSHDETRGWSVEIPSGFSTWRHKYSLFMDLLGMASADVAQYSDITKRVVFSDGYNRSYMAMLANYKNNKGQRLFVLTDGPGTHEKLNDDLIPFVKTKTISHPSTEAFVKFFTLYLVDKFSTLVATPHVLAVPFRVIPELTNAVLGEHYDINRDSIGPVLTPSNMPVALIAEGPTRVQEGSVITFKWLLEMSDGFIVEASRVDSRFGLGANYPTLGGGTGGIDLAEGTFHVGDLKNGDLEYAFTVNLSISFKDGAYLTTTYDMIMVKDPQPEFVFADHPVLTNEIAGTLIFNIADSSVGLYGSTINFNSPETKTIAFHLDVSNIWDGDPDIYLTYNIG